MPGNMRLHTRPPGHEFPVDDTPPSTRPSSAASTSSTPNRSTSMDSLHTNSSTSEKPTGEEFIPTRIIRAAPKVNANAMQFVKTGPASLHKSAKEQMKKAEVVKSLRKTSLQEEEEWQSNSPSSNPPTLEESSDWQANLDKWKSSRRKRNEDVLERVIEVKKYEKEEEYTKGRRKSKTFSEMREGKDKRGRRYNLVVHDTDNDDLSELGLNSGKVDVLSSLSDATEDVEPKDLYNDNKDAKSDAGFCTGSDTGSDGVFAEDNISDTSSALGDKKDAHDSLLDSGLPLNSKEPTEPLIMNDHISLTNSMSLSSSHQNSEYTYDKAIEEYKQFAENSVKKRTPSVSSLCSNTSLSKDDDKTMYRSQDLSKKMDDKLSFFHREMDQDLKTRVKEPRVIRREKNLKVDINKRRSMFELRDIDSKNHEHKQINRRSVVDVSNKLKTKVMSFENISESDKRTCAVTPQRDTKFKEKLANFSQKESHSSSTATPTRKKTPERDQNFYKKLQSFTRMESEEVTTKSIPRTLNSSPKKPISIGTRDNKFPSRRSPERKISAEVGREKSSIRSGMPLKERIASFENLSPADEILRTREKSVSMECLNKPLFTNDFKPLNSSISVSNLYRRTPSTPFMVVEVDENVESEETCTKSRMSRSYLSSSTVERKEQTLRNSSENIIKNNVFTNNREDDIPPLGPPPKVPNFSTSSGNSKIMNSQRRASPSPTRISPTVQKSSSPARRSPSPSINRVPLSPTKRSPSPTTSRTSASPTRNSSIPSVNRGSISPTRRISLPKVPDSPPPAPPPQIPDSPPNGFSPLTPEIAPDIPKCAPPNFGFQGHSQSYSNSTIEIMSQELEEFEPQDSIDDMTHLQEYGDEDIDEVIDNYEHLSESVTGEELPQHHFYESALEMGSLPNDQLSKDLYTENMYERIQDDEPVYENIYEKVLDVGEVEVLDSLEGSLEHQYQTLEEVKTEVENLVSPPLPPKNNSSSSIEVLDVTWTDEYSTPIMPPSVPPPPPPPDEDDFEDGMDGEETVPLSLFLSASNLEQEERQPRSTTSTKQELRQKMSDFLGTQPQIQEELTLKPPPDVNEILRQERVEERMIVQKQQNLSREIPLMDFDPLLPQPYRPRYTWEDRMRDDSVRPQDLNESSDQMNFQLKLEELEQEMVKHDREMLQRVKSSNSLEEKSKEHNGQTCTDSKITHPNTNQTIQDDYRPLPMEHNNLSSVSAEENIYSVTSTANIPPPSQYSEFARGIPSNQQIYSEAYYEEETGSVSSRTSRQPNLASQADLPVNLPLQEFYKTPIIDEQLSNDSNHINYQENISYEEDSNSVQESLYRNEVGATTEAQPRKQSILALSAIPKPRLTDNDSWIMKKKADAGKKDYNKHWLFQEAEQRRLEQQDRISRMKPTLTESSSLNKLSNTLPTTSSYQSHFQNVKSNFNQTTNANYSYNVANGAQSPANVYNSSNVSNVSPSPYSSPNSSSSNIIKPPRSIQPSSSSSNFSASYATSGQPFIPNGTMNGSNNNWMKQTKTYQPEIPLPTTTSSKPLPDSIINTLTQRVNNKNKNIPSSRTPVYKTNYRDDNYHDYMNTEFNSSTSNTSPTIPQGVIPQGVIPQGGIPQSQSSPAPEDQRLLSVSGKKKCSHCGEELGRGAAMIIESLRLFYHIPCFKCCVCGIQLGNGTSGADVRVRNHKLHCHNCYSNDEGMKFSKV